jgi:hypothetical protein
MVDELDRLDSTATSSSLSDDEAEIPPLEWGRVPTRHCSPLSIILPTSAVMSLAWDVLHCSRTFAWRCNRIAAGDSPL